MALDLERVQPTRRPAPATTVDVVRDAAALKDWVRVAVAGFDMPVLTRDAVEAIVTPALAPGAPWILYLGRVAGKPVATSCVYFAHGVAGIYWVATLEAARGQGLGTAVTLAPLRDARERGYRVAILQATEMGRPIYERLGFDAYGVVDQYVRLPGATP